MKQAKMKKDKIILSDMVLKVNDSKINHFGLPKNLLTFK